MQLEDIIDLKILQEIQDCFSEATGFAAIIVDYTGKPLLEYSNFSSFCDALRTDPFYNDKCCKSDAHAGLEAARCNDIFVFKCHAGLIDFAIPIIVDGVSIATMMCGQVLAEEGDDLVPELMEHSKNILTDKPDCKKLYDQALIVPFKKIVKSAEFMRAILKYVIDGYLLSKKNESLTKEQEEKEVIKKLFKELEFKYYNSQLNPHFLFNALNSIGRMAYLEKADKTQEVIYSLADMLRNSLKDKSELISIDEELSTIKNYAFIQNIRFGEELVFDYDISREVLRLKIPPMLIYILVENAVLHGLEKQQNLGTVNIKVVQKGSKLLIEVKDNGVGFKNEILKCLKEGNLDKIRIILNNSNGILNIYKRLEYFFEKDFSVNFESRINGFTTVTVTIPISD